jgi:hypothetical protein
VSGARSIAPRVVKAAETRGAMLRAPANQATTVFCGAVGAPAVWIGFKSPDHFAVRRHEGRAPLAGGREKIKI